MTDKRCELLENGYTKFENVLDADFLARLRAATDAMLAGQTPQQREALRAQGSLLHTTGDCVKTMHGSGSRIGGKPCLSHKSRAMKTRV